MHRDGMLVLLVASSVLGEFVRPGTGRLSNTASSAEKRQALHWMPLRDTSLFVSDKTVLPPKRRASCYPAWFCQIATAFSAADADANGSISMEAAVPAAAS